MADDKIPPDIAKMSFEDALGALEKIVGELEQGTNRLDDAISAYERGTLLKKHCEVKLSQAKERIEKVSLGPDGKATSEPVDIE